MTAMDFRTACRVIDEQVAVNEAKGGGGPQPPDWERRLTAREVQIVDLVGRGLSNQEIADRISVKRLTVKQHLRRISEAIGCGRRGGIVGSLYRARVLEPGTEPAAWVGDLHHRQLEVVDLASRGFTNKEIARTLSLSRDAVGSRMVIAARLVGCSERAGMVGAFFRAGVLK